MGRVSSLDWFISIAGLPVSYALTAPAAAAFGARATLVGAGVPGGVVTIAALLLPGMRGVDGALGEVVGRRGRSRVGVHALLGLLLTLTEHLGVL